MLHACGSLKEVLLSVYQVAFFSIEMSGPQGSKEQRENVFTEVRRDPEEANRQFEYKFWFRNLKPGTSYTFRIRAFNGYGPGPYNWENFTTRPARPMQPVALSKSPNTVTLRWEVDDGFSRHVDVSAECSLVSP